MMVNNIAPPTESMFSNKNFVIMVLLFLLILSFLGINVFLVLGNFFQSLINIFGPPIKQILSIFGYTTGTVLNESSEIVATVTKTGIDIADGTVQSVGDLLIKASTQGVDTRQLDKSLNTSNLNIGPPPQADSTTSPIQNPITSNKKQWCLVGEYEGKRGCIEVSEQDKCLSGQVYPAQKLCLNPTLSR